MLLLFIGLQGTALAGDDLAETAHEMESPTLELNNALEASRGEMEALKQSHADVTDELRARQTQVQTLQESLRALEKEKSKLPAQLSPAAVSTSNGNVVVCCTKTGSILNVCRL